MISIICQSHTCRRPVLISPVITHAAIKLLTHTLMQMLSALICICDVQTAIILQPPVAFWYNTRYIKTEGKRIFSCPPRSVCFADWQPQSLKSSAHYCSGSETGREDWAFILPDIYSLLYQPVFFPPRCPPSFCFLRIFPATCLELLKIVQSRETQPGFCPSATAFFILLVKFPSTKCGHGLTQIYVLKSKIWGENVVI